MLQGVVCAFKEHKGQIWGILGKKNIEGSQKFDERGGAVETTGWQGRRTIYLFHSQSISIARIIFHIYTKQIPRNNYRYTKQFYKPLRIIPTTISFGNHLTPMLSNLK